MFTQQVSFTLSVLALGALAIAGCPGPSPATTMTGGASSHASTTASVGSGPGGAPMSTSTSGAAGSGSSTGGSIGVDGGTSANVVASSSSGHADGGLLGDGSPCTASSMCQSGNCLYGVCCGVSCKAPCNACSKELTGGTQGVCGPILATVTTPTSACPPAPPCGNTGSCDGRGNCAVGAQGLMCGNMCVGSAMLGPGVCNGSGGCTGVPMPCPNGTACSSATGCSTGCMTIADCAPGFYCAPPSGGTGPGMCVLQLPPGAICMGPMQCASGICGGGPAGGGSTRCCAQACSTVAGPCAALGCDATGACVYGTGQCNQVVSCSGSTETVNTMCDGKGGCTLSPMALTCPGGYICNGMSDCLTGCAGATDCAPQATTCKTNVCVSAKCGTTNAKATTPCQDHGGVQCDGFGTCVNAKFVFVTKSALGPIFGGASMADTLCGVAASAAGLVGTWVAWVSDAQSTAISRLPPNTTTDYVLLDGTPVVHGLLGLFGADGGVRLGSPIDVDETLGKQGGVQVWTGTNPDGTASKQDCADWTSNAAPNTGTVGNSSAIDGTWTADLEVGCTTTSAHIYCFQQ